MSRLIQALGRANSHFRYWHYRRSLGNGGPSFVASASEWWRRFKFELGNIKGQANG